jgi:nucleotide-binding universal stress UspA family protein
MIKKIVVALDDGDTCDWVFEQAMGLAQTTEATLHLISILTPEGDDSLTFYPYSDRDWASDTKRYRELKTTGFRLLESFGAKAQAVGIKVEVTQEMGTPGPSICQLARIWDADLVVVGSHGRKGLTEMLLGSVSNYVVHHATCSIMVVHQHQISENTLSRQQHPERPN